MNLSHKVLPIGWKYLVPMRRMKSFVREQLADVRKVDFSGTAGTPIYSWSAARFDSRVVDDELAFRITLLGIPESILDLADYDISERTFKSLQSFLHQCNQPFDSTTPPQIGFISLRIQDDELVFTYKVSKSDNRQLPTTPWW